ncbi:dCTP deaminase [Enterococcus caccae]|uniref:Deoxycytidine triphosphate deaminase n=1 Tax=Enterococcus caccae ATCC BAA-1240 TaxID=1158612 RepID=R3W7A3_9ENTE|nr:deoxycytidine triphosphate deaminase [Enterococcus caccae]EOL43661.1 deoxycytidine triphosphate deaminase [Enterococcus caccae ATCC BAA-1240]EOT67939.1 deoxycytidine triphosphate deaminase [Enterococcus caccae ATCC BAA-1240]OJG28573.1 deoxycytidine triphosphate deaminase [Enterococcus caccae]
MILTGNEITKEFYSGKIKFSQFDMVKIGTNSYDLCLGSELIFYQDDILDVKKENKYKIIEIPDEGIVIPKHSFCLGSSSIKLGSDFYVPIIHGKSTTARMGLFVHITADLIDIGFYGTTTFQLHNLLPIKLYKGMPIAQVSFWKPKGDIVLYDGKYQGAETPLTSKVYKDFR